MRVGECRQNLVNRDEEIVQLKLALEASKQESLAKDGIIADKKESMHKISQDFQIKRRENNEMLAVQRAANTQTAVDAMKKVAESTKLRDAAVAAAAEAKDEAAAQVLLTIGDRDAKISEALADNKRSLQAERQYRQQRTNEVKAKVHSKLFSERVVH